jgi:NTE family protein
VATRSNRRHGLVLQGGGALGAYELGAARAIYSEGSSFQPEVIAGVSIGAISAVLLARPAKGHTPLQALEAFWTTVTTSAFFPYASLVANPPFYLPTIPLTPLSTSLYQTAPLLSTLAGLVDTEALADPTAEPRLIVTATNIETSELKTFDSADPALSLTLDHILASGSLPPNFPAVRLPDGWYWDGGVFDNTPLGAVLDALDGDLPSVLVINLFPKIVPRPTSMAQVLQSFTNLLFVNKTESDLKLMRKFNVVVDFMEDLERTFPDDPRIEALSGYEKLKAYRRVAKVMEVTRESAAQPLEGSDFSHAGIERRAAEGRDQTAAKLKDCGFMGG